VSPIVLSGLFFYAFLAYCFYRILTRVGYPPLAALLVFLPFVGQGILVAWLAFGRWPLLAHAEAWRDWYESVTDESET
jgi:hypothetical protein